MVQRRRTPDGDAFTRMCGCGCECGWMCGCVGAGVLLRTCGVLKVKKVREGHVGACASGGRGEARDAGLVVIQVQLWYTRQIECKQWQVVSQ